jgi:hypothetical protein
MVVGVRDFLRRGAKPALLVATLALCSLPTLGQVKSETPQQTNDKIQQLAAQAQARPEGTPIGTGDLIHVDVI